MRVKSRTYTNCSIQISWTDRKDANISTAATESFLLMSVISSKKNRDVEKLTLPNAFVQS